MRITDLWDDRMPAAASARRRAGRVRPASPRAPIRRKLRRNRRCGATGTVAVRPWRVGMDSLAREGYGGSASVGAGAGWRPVGGEVLEVVSPRFAPGSM